MSKKTYFLLAPSTGLVKIGCSNDPVGRMLDLRTMNAATVEPLVVLRTPEAELHERFAMCRHHGEWFRVCEKMIAYMETINEPYAADRLRLTKQDRHER